MPFGVRTKCHLWGVSNIFYEGLKLRFPDVEVNRDSRAVPQCCRVMFSNINGLHRNRDELAIAVTKFDVVACVEKKITGQWPCIGVAFAWLQSSNSTVEKCSPKWA